SRLKALVVSQWGNYGLPPKQSSFIMHATVVQHYLGGGYYPLGGSHHIFESIKNVILEKGGACLTSHPVTEIIVEDGKAIGVRACAERDSGSPTKEFYADKIISDAGAYNTYLKLLPKVDIPFGGALKQFYKSHPAVGNVTLYLGLRESPTTLGFGGENHWIYSSYDHDANFAASRARPQTGNDWFDENELAGVYLSFPSLKNAHATAHTAEIIAFTDYTFFEKWKEEPWKKRAEEYKQLKEKISQKLIAFVNARYPGFADLIEYRELSTPISTEHFTDHPQGSIYGVPSVPDRFAAAKAPWCNPQSPVENLYLTGADVSSPGVAGAMMGAVATLSHLPNGFKLLDLMRLQP
ncbi:MAG TPA: NAD(P)/FAD-dependent oxidoreductase, partial [Turneriella sp.]|nr:NAD(P)/FAD-dependent oxidoreductase [Turneriella sp.]